MLVDKPMACTTADADEMIAAADANDVVLVPFQNTRFAAPFVAAHDAVADGRIGEVTGFRAAFGHAGPQAWAPGATWFFDRAVAGGGCLIDLGVHVVDLVRCVTGDDIDGGGGVRATAGRGDVETDAQLLAAARQRRDRHDPRELVVASRARPPAHGDRHRRARCTSTTARRSRSSTLDGERERVELPETTSSPLGELLAAMRGERAPSVTAADGRAAVAVVEAAYRSANERRTRDGR